MFEYSKIQNDKIPVYEEDGSSQEHETKEPYFNEDQPFVRHVAEWLYG